MIPSSAANGSASSNLVHGWRFISRRAPKSKSRWVSAWWEGRRCWRNLPRTMADHPAHPPGPPDDSQKLKIYFLPNLLTAGNLFCGFVALTRIVEANIDMGD